MPHSVVTSSNVQRVVDSGLLYLAVFQLWTNSVEWLRIHRLPKILILCGPPQGLH